MMPGSGMMPQGPMMPQQPPAAAPAAPSARVGPFTALAKGAEAQTAAIQQQTEALQATLRMMAEQHQTLASFMTLIAQIGEMLHQMMAKSHADTERLLAALTAPKQIDLQTNEQGKATGATVRPAQ